MATKSTTTGSTPAPANLAAVAVAIGNLPNNKVYPNRQAMLVAAHPALALPTNKGLCTSARQVLRAQGQYVAHTGSSITPAQWLAAYKAGQAQRQAGQHAAQAATARQQYGRRKAHA